MESSERASVRRALDDLKPFLTAFVTQHGGASAQSADTAALLKAIVANWEVTYSRHLPRVAQSYVHELIDVRNRWAHEAAFSAVEARRAADTAAQLLTAIGGPVVGGTKKPPVKTTSREKKWSGQRELMREIFAKARGNEVNIIREYANAERAGVVQRKRTKSGLTPEQYAKALLADGLKKGWLG